MRMAIYFREGCEPIFESSKMMARDKMYDSIFRDLMQECKNAAPGARLSKKLRSTLERLPPPIRRSVVSRYGMDGCAPLFLAARRGNVEMIDYLITVCDAPLEQRGVYEINEEHTVHLTTPLWCAAVSGHVRALHSLVEAGANIDAGSDTGSTPLRSACFMTHHEVVKYLVIKGADVNRPNYSGGTCLINSVQSSTITKILIERGANVNATDLQGKTALHYAAQEHRIETAKVLLNAGADPKITSETGDDVLRTAALKGSSQIVQLLVSDAPRRYNDEEAANAFELLGATLLDEYNDVTAALNSWTTATAFRIANVPKQLPVPHRCIPEEWTTLDDLEVIANDIEVMRDQALAVLYRILGGNHRELALRLMYRGAGYADSFLFEHSLELWLWALQLRVSQHTLLYTESCVSLCAWTRLCGDVWWGAETQVNLDIMMRLADLLLPALPHAASLLQIRPQYTIHQELFDRSLRCLTHLIFLMNKSASTPEEEDQVLSVVSKFVSQGLRSSTTGDWLLHLATSRLNLVNSTYLADDPHAPLTFPCVEVVRTLCDGGATPDCTNFSGSTPLHVAVIPTNYNQEVIECLLSYGAHIDRQNRFGDSPYSILWSRPALRPVCFDHIRLTCLSANAIPNKPEILPFLPSALKSFVQLHMPYAV